jgi:hypothetical protein
MLKGEELIAHEHFMNDSKAQEFSILSQIYFEEDIDFPQNQPYQKIVHEQSCEPPPSQIPPHARHRQGSRCFVGNSESRAEWEV